MPASVNVVIATYRRPERLSAALESLRRSAEAAGDRVVAGVTVVDDDPAGSAAVVEDGFAGAFAGGFTRVPCGSRNISTARNTGLQAALGTAEWIGSIDDDVVVPERWFDRCLDAVEAGDFDAVTGPLAKDFSRGPAWLTSEPFDQIGILVGRDGEPAFACATGNNWVSEQFLARHPDLRFDPELGRTGGEDMDFFYRAVEAGLRPVFSSAVAVTEREPPERCTLRYQLRRAFWMGVSEAHIGLRRGKAGRLRLAARAVRRALERGGRQLSPTDRRRRGLRYDAAVLAQCLGLLLGACGLTWTHK